jgi:hypothetical protein
MNENSIFNDEEQTIAQVPTPLSTSTQPRCLPRPI